MPKAARTTKAGPSSRPAGSRRDKTANSGKAAKKPRGRPFPKGVSGNPKGRPLRGESYAEIVREIGSLTGNELADVMCNRWAPELRSEIGTVRMKDALVIRAHLAFFRDPTGSMFNAITDRAEGKPVSHIEVEGLVKGYSEVSPDDWDSDS